MAERHAAKPTARPADRSVPLVIRQPDTPQAMMNLGDTFTTRFLKLFVVKKFCVVSPVRIASSTIRMMIALLDINFLILNVFSMIAFSLLIQTGLPVP
jgi:hypothetical protein